MSRRYTAAESLATAATLFAGPGKAANDTSSVDMNVGFHFSVENIQTLSTHGSPDQGSITGLMFVPSLEPHDSCINTTAPFVPSNVTRQEDVLGYGYRVIGLAPWVSVNCTRSFLAASRKAELEALVFYQPRTGTDERPPPVNDPIWSLDDGGHWKEQNEYPIYAIPGEKGETLMRQLSMYPGNATKSHGNRSLATPGQQGDVRLFTLINLDHPASNMPSLWGFTLVILGTLIVVVIVILICYRVVQKRRRESLQRRIVAGEVDLEMLGLGQMKVPQEILDKLPLYIYPCLTVPTKAVLVNDTAQPDKTQDPQKDKRTTICLWEEISAPESDPCEIKRPETAAPKTCESELVSHHAEPDKREEQEHRLSHAQTTCAICLDDFDVGKSMVRELPCAHIFHAGCIDPFLLQNSSLCPLCKKSVLPSDYYPVSVTNIMVHREYMMRRRRW